jgi:hypothetical protein
MMGPMDRRQWRSSVAGGCALALVLACASGCARKPEEASRTQTTSSDNFIERTRVIDDMFVRSEDNPAGWGADAAAAEPTGTDGGRAPATAPAEEPR